MCEFVFVSICLEYLWKNVHKTRHTGLPTRRAGRESAVLFCAESLSRVRLFATPWTVARQAPLSMGSPRQEYWSGLPFPPSRGSS